jgi:alpha-L-fucosidase
MPEWLAGSSKRFDPTWDSLSANYRAPEWFRDAKLGLWAHWSAQCVPEQGDWYARKMYIQGERAYEHHLRSYGHPSQTGFMEIDNLWKAERWEPEALMRRYVAAGAKYFVALANHHDNFDNFNSRHHAWNSVNIGPKKDIIGTWARLARSHGLKFGVTNHSAHSWHWFQPAYGYDAEGPMAGRRYDAFHLKRSDGVGKWWEGLDPQELYCGPSMVVPDGITSAAEMRAWHEAHDRVWTEAAPVQNPEFVRRWTLRCLDLMDSYNPDLVYFDNFDLPLGQAGLDVTAHYYNTNMARNGGRLECVVNAKNIPDQRRGALVEDVERGFRTDIMPTPWQTDTCIGDWHYDRSIYEEHRYKTVTWVVHALCDIVSKNGNLLLNIPVRGDGSIDSDEEKFLDGLGAWMAVNGEAIFATRPWRTFGEGPSRAPGGMFNEDKQQFTGADVRFTQKNGVLYALMLGWPNGGRAQIEALADGAQYAHGTIEQVELLGSQGALAFQRDASGLQVTLPESRNGDMAYALKINGQGLV